MIRLMRSVHVSSVSLTVLVHKLIHSYLILALHRLDQGTANILWKAKDQRVNICNFAGHKVSAVVA